MVIAIPTTCPPSSGRKSGEAIPFSLLKEEVRLPACLNAFQFAGRFHLPLGGFARIDV
jgi:hypothetical protein